MKPWITIEVTRDLFSQDREKWIGMTDKDTRIVVVDADGKTYMMMSNGGWGDDNQDCVCPHCGDEHEVEPTAAQVRPRETVRYQ